MLTLTLVLLAAAVVVSVLAGIGLAEVLWCLCCWARGEEE